jgi:hypothetical protein
MKRFWQLNYQLYILSSKQHLMHHLSYTKRLGLTNTPTHFGAGRRHLHLVPPQLLVSHHVKLYPKTVRKCFAEIQPSFAIHDFWILQMVASMNGHQHYVKDYHLKYIILKQLVSGQFFETIWHVEIVPICDGSPCRWRWRVPKRTRVTNQTALFNVWNSVH